MSVRVERSGPVFTIVIHRPEAKNAIDRATAHALSAAFDELERDESALVGVLYGDGGTFSAGADLKAVATGVANDIDPDGPGPLGPTRRIPQKPVIAAVEGYAVAGGLELALLCDMRVMAEDAIFGVFCRRWGVPLIDGGTVRLPRIIGQGRALDMILTGRPVAADEALAWGLANRVVPKGKAREAAEALAAELARFPQGCLRTDRKSAYEGWDAASFDAALRAEGRAGFPIVAQEAVAGAARFAAGKGRHGGFGKDDI